MKWSSVSVAWTFVTRVARGLIIPKLIAPAEYGLFTSLNVLLNYSQYSDLGVKYQLSKRLPYEIGRGGEPAYRKMVDEGMTWIFSTSMVFAAGVLMYSFFQHGEHAWFYRPALRLIALVILFNRLRDFLGVSLVSREEFRRNVECGILVDGLNLVVTIVLLYAVGIIGAVWALLVSEIVGTIYYLRYMRIGLVSLRGSEMLGRVTESLLLLAVVLLDATMSNVDQLFLLKFFSKQQFGIYSLGLAFQGIAQSIASVFMGTIQPRVMGLAGEGRHPEVSRLVDSTVTLFLVLTLASLTLLIPAMAVVVRFYLPKYAAGIPTYVLLAGFALVRGPALLLRPFFMAHDQEKHLVGYQLLALTLAASLDAVVIWRGGGLNAVAAASFAGYSAVSILMLLHFQHIGKTGFNPTKYLILLLGTGTIVAAYWNFHYRRMTDQIGLYLLASLPVAIISLLLLGTVAWFMRRQLLRDAQQFVSH
jgi:O-antigen/teichoic acid export membrane protein